MVIKNLAWNYFLLFGQGKVEKYILEDEAPSLITDPSWTKEQNETQPDLNRNYYYKSLS